MIRTALNIASELVAVLDDLGYEREESILGLAQALVDYADGDRGLLSAAIDTIDSGGFEPEYETISPRSE